jgi:hypothetical protein
MILLLILGDHQQHGNMEDNPSHPTKRTTKKKKKKKKKKKTKHHNDATNIIKSNYNNPILDGSDEDHFTRC